MNTIRSFYVLAMACILVACKEQANNREKKSGSYQQIDLFKEQPAQHNDPSVQLSADSAFRYSELVVISGSVSLADSSRNRSDRDDFYVYSAAIDTVLKGSTIKKNTRILFASSAQLRSLPLATYTLYLLPWAEHRMIKKGLPVQWQWLVGAPF